MREVFIDGIPMDVTQSDAVDAIFESPIFTDISKIKSNITTTYKLPKTERNLAIFENSDQFDIVQQALDEQDPKDPNKKNYSYPYREHSFSEYRSGLSIIRNGRCRLLTISDSIELAVVWGTKVPMTELLKYKLTELSDPNKGKVPEIYLPWSNATKFEEVTDTNDYGFIYGDFGQGLARDMNDGTVTEKRNQYSHPSMNVMGILKTIGQATGVHMQLPVDEEGKSLNEDLQDRFNKTWIPCLTKNADAKIFDETSVSFKFDHFHKGGGKHKPEVVAFALPEGDPYNLFHNDTPPHRFVLGASKIQVKLEGDITFEGSEHEGKHIGICFSRDYVYTNKEHHKLDKNHYTIVYNPTTNKSVAKINFNFPFEISDADLTYKGKEEMQAPIYVILYFADFDGSFKHKLEFTSGGFPKVNITGNLQYAGNLVTYKKNFPVLKNLPDITCSDFLKSVMGMFGLYPWLTFKDEQAIIELLSINDIYNNVANAKDWSNKQLVGDVTIERTYLDYGQVNYLRYQEDEDVSLVSEGIIEVKNETLPAEKEILQLKFSTTDSNITNNNIDGPEEQAFIPIYVANIENENEIEYNAGLKARILSEGKKEFGDDIKKYKLLTFNESMKFEKEDGLIKNYYDAYKKVVYTPIVMSLSVKLTDLDIHLLSGKDIIHFRGRYWMPIRIQVGIDGKANCKFILLPDIL